MKVTLKKYTHDGVLKGRRTCKVTSGAVNGSVVFTPPAFEKGRTVVSQASKYILGRHRGRGTRNKCSHIRPGQISSTVVPHGPPIVSTDPGSLKGVNRSATRKENDLRAKKLAIQKKAAENRLIRKGGIA